MIEHRISQLSSTQDIFENEKGLYKKRSNEDGRCCDLCITEKLAILLVDQRYSLNQRNELLAKCPHKT